VYQWSPWQVSEACICNAIHPAGLLNFKQFIHFCILHGLILSGGIIVYSFEQRWNSTLHPPFVVVTQVMGCALIFQTDIVLDFSNG
jgi:hypothetical protein